MNNNVFCMIPLFVTLKKSTLRASSPLRSRAKFSGASGETREVFGLAARFAIRTQSTACARESRARPQRRACSQARKSHPNILSTSKENPLILYLWKPEAGFGEAKYQARRLGGSGCSDEPPQLPGKVRSIAYSQII